MVSLLPNLGTPQYVSTIPQTVAQQPVVYAPYTQENPNAAVSPGTVFSVARNAGSFFNSGGGIKNAINTFGANNLGTANVPTSFVGPLQPGVTSGMTLTQGLGAAGVGALIGSINPWVRNKTGGQVGGAAGGTIGMSVGGPIGAGVGSFIGSTLGGMIGGKPKTPGASFEAILDKEYNYTSPSLLSKHMGTEGPAQVSQELTPYLQNMKSMGITLPENLSVGTYFEKNGNGVLFYRDKAERDADTKQYKINYDPSNPADKARAYRELTSALAAKAGASQDTLTAISNFSPQGSSPDLSSGIVPMVEARAGDKQTFAQFLEEYKKRNVANG